MNQETMTFEQSLKRLEEIVRTMERGDAPLEESLKLFEEGATLVRTCNKLLSDAKMQVTKITAAPDGEPMEEVFDDGSDF